MGEGYASAKKATRAVVICFPIALLKVIARRTENSLQNSVFGDQNSVPSQRAGDKQKQKTTGHFG